MRAVTGGRNPEFEAKYQRRRERNRIGKGIEGKGIGTKRFGCHHSFATSVLGKQGATQGTGLASRLLPSGGLTGPLTKAASTAEKILEIRTFEFLPANATVAKKP